MEKNKKGISPVKYLLQTTVMVVPLCAILALGIGYGLDIENEKIVPLVITIMFAGFVLGVTISLKNYIKFIKPLNLLGELAQNLDENNLNYSMDVLKAGGQKDIISNLNSAIGNLRKVISEMKNMGESVASSSEQMNMSTEGISKGSEQVASAISDLSKSSTEQAMSTEKASREISEIIEGLNRISTDMNNSEGLTQQAKKVVSIGEQSVQYQEVKMKESRAVSQDVSGAIMSLSEKSNEIGQIIEAIKGLADKTNLLSLNAAIEAARAGEHGRGFAVVAEEVRNLSVQSAKSVEKIGEIIVEVQSGIEHAVSKIHKSSTVVEEQEKALIDTINSFKDISTAVASIHDNIKTVAATAINLSHNAKQSGTLINDITALAEEIASSSEEIAAYTEEQSSAICQIAESSQYFTKLSVDLKSNIKKFNV